MRRMWLVVGLLAATASSAAMAAGADSTGCGLGTMIFEGQSGRVPQILAVTTNGTFGNQTFGITSGTLGCVSDGTVKPAQRMAMFMGANMDKVAQDMSRGDGEALRTLADLKGVEPADRAAFYRTAQANVGRIFPSDQVTAGEALHELDVVLAESPELRRYAATA